MGMYTELLLKAEVEDETPPQVMRVLEYFFKGGPEPESLPDHPLFEKPRWEMIGRSSSYYHIPWPDGGMGRGGAERGTWYIFSRSDLKNYDGEIEAFLDWSRPYLRPATGSCLGWTWYEEAEHPTMILREVEDE